MKLVEQHIISENHTFFKECDRLCFLGKNLYNQALFQIRQHFFETGKYLNYVQLQKRLQNTHQQDYVALPRKVSQAILRKVDEVFSSFFNANKSYQKNPQKFKAKPKIPGYKDKVNGRFVVIYNAQAISKKTIKKGILNPSQTDIYLPTKLVYATICEVRIIPKNQEYVIEIVYDKQTAKPKKDNKRYAAIDIGLDNLATVTFNTENVPFIFNGKPLKAMNAFFNKKRAELMSYIGGKGKSNRLTKLINKRNKKVKDYLHKASRQLVNQLVENDISILVIGKNNDWKQDINLGRKNNQNFVSIPHTIFVEMLQYKCELVGIKVKLIEESYTSKCSFLDNESIKKHEKYQGRRIKRGLFKTSKGILINADVNASLNIMKKGIPKAFTNGIQDVVVRPLRVTPQEPKKAKTACVAA